MRTLDTNLLVRIAAGDDPINAAKVEPLLAGPARVHIPMVVLCEFVWTLRATYKVDRRNLADAVRFLTEPRHVVVDREAVAAGLDMLDRGGDFADGVILHEARRAGSDGVSTFDRDFARLGAPEVELVS